MTLRKYTPIPWLGTALVAAMTLSATFAAGIVQATAFLPVLAVVAAIDYRRTR